MIYVDSNIFIYLLEGNATFGRLASKKLTGKQIITSTLTITECLASTKNQFTPDLLTRMPGLSLLAVNSAVATKAGELRRLHNIGLGDALHLATALAEGASSLLTNDKAFAKIAVAYLPAETLEVNT